MSDRRRFNWKSGRLATSPIADGWAIDLDSRDPQIPNLPLESPTAGGQSVLPDAGSITITGYAPTVSQPIAVGPAVGSIVLTGYAPTVAQAVAVNPGAGAITITGYAPSISQPQAVNPDAGTLTLTGYAPVVTQGANQSADPEAGSLTLTGHAPTVAQTGGQNTIITLGGPARRSRGVEELLDPQEDEALQAVLALIMNGVIA